MIFITKKTKSTKKSFLITALIATLIAIGAIAYAQTGQGHPWAEIRSHSGTNFVTGTDIDESSLSCSVITGSSSLCDGNDAVGVSSCSSCDSRFVNEGDDQKGSLSCTWRDNGPQTFSSTDCTIDDGDSPCHVTVNCLSGEIATGGGCELFPDHVATDATKNPWAYYNYPLRYTEGWYCGLLLQETGKEVVITAYVKCCKVV